MAPGVLWTGIGTRSPDATPGKSRMNNEESPLVAGWWARLPDGGMRRIWATLADGIYRCRVEVCSPAQEEARMRLFQAVSAADALGRPLDHDGSADALVWSCSTFASLD